tara:strand:- start:149 stop:1093 length:945 start_codon:yes stop_codon:yes gene_type:complete
MKNKPILIVPGDPKSIFFEIFFKSLKSNRLKSPLILITSLNIFKHQMKRFKFNKSFKLINLNELNNNSFFKSAINIINVDYDRKKKPKTYIKKSFEIAFKILKTNLTNKFLNGPINKTKFLDKKYLGITEYIAAEFRISKIAMLIYNKDLSVCPLTTHLPIRLVSKSINQKLIEEKIELINNFFKKNIGFKPKIAIVGLNPHCESILKYKEDEKIVFPAVKSLKKKGYKVYGPFPADTIFLKQNRKKYNVVLGMYHDQVLSPIKALKEYNAINITLGVPFFRVSPDHGPNEKMINKNLSNPLSLIKAMKFLDQR